MSWIVSLVVLSVVVGYGILLYNHLVALRHNVARGWSNIDVLLKQRYDELPKLVAVCRQYMGYEQETLTKVMQAHTAVAMARAGRDVPALGQAETQLRLGLGSLFTVAGAYPDLKADGRFQHLQQRVTELGGGIADRCEYYNASVTLNNVRIGRFPGVLIARPFGFGPFELLEFGGEDKVDIDIRGLFEHS